MKCSSVWIPSQILLLWVPLALQGQTPAAPAPAAKTRTVRIGGTRGQPAYSLRVLTRGSEGVIEVLDASAVNVQTLTCPLLRDVPNPTKDELDGSGTT
jgi:hypothetical protein